MTRETPIKPAAVPIAVLPITAAPVMAAATIVAPTYSPMNGINEKKIATRNEKPRRRSLNTTFWLADLLKVSVIWMLSSAI